MLIKIQLYVVLFLSYKSFLLIFISITIKFCHNFFSPDSKDKKYKTKNKRKISLTNDVYHKREEVFAGQEAGVVEVLLIRSPHGHVLTDHLEGLPRHGLKLLLSAQTFCEDPLQEGQAVHKARSTVILLVIILVGRSVCVFPGVGVSC